MGGDASGKQVVVYFEGAAYDVTAFVGKHPGGAKAISMRAGQDITEAFYANGHSKGALMKLQKMKMEGAVAPAASGAAPAAKAGAASKSWTRDVRLAAARALNECGCMELTFEWAGGEAPPTVAPGAHVKLSATGAGAEPVARSYTPVSTSPKGFVLAVKLYERGAMSQVLRVSAAGLAAGSPPAAAVSFSAQGPHGGVQYAQKQVRDLEGGGEASCESGLVLVAGGTGITPFLAAMRAGLVPPGKTTLIYLVASAGEAMYRSELEKLCTLKLLECKRETMAATLTAALPAPQPNTVVVICGPPGMEEAARTAVSAAGHGVVLATTMLGDLKKSSAPSGPTPAEKQAEKDRRTVQQEPTDGGCCLLM
jgi:nitrate reductase (NAD(P)H)